MTRTPDRSTAALWARFRFSVVGSLLSSPPARGRLKAAIRALADKTWTHPVSGREVRFAAGTIERWYYTAQRAKDDPVGVLQRAVRKDCGKVTLAPVYLELVATDAQTTHLEVMAEVGRQKQGSLQDQVLALLAGGVMQTRAALRNALGVKNQRLGEALESLEQGGQIRRTPTGWRRVE